MRRGRFQGRLTSRLRKRTVTSNNNSRPDLLIWHPRVAQTAGHFFRVIRMCAIVCRARATVSRSAGLRSTRAACCNRHRLRDRHVQRRIGAEAAPFAFLCFWRNSGTSLNIAATVGLGKEESNSNRMSGNCRRATATGSRLSVLKSFLLSARREKAERGAPDAIRLFQAAQWYRPSWPLQLDCLDLACDYGSLFSAQNN